MIFDLVQDDIDSNHTDFIRTKDWMPSHPDLEYPLDFVVWIDSINSGWQNKVRYEKFELYRKQAEQWLSDTTDITDFETEGAQREWLIGEIQRCKDNSLYFCNKYGFIKEDKAKDGSGKIKYKAWEAQEILLFLFDCGYSMMIGKARQIGFTTTMCLAGMKKVNLFKSYFIKFITHTEDKGEEIFKDKVKWAYAKIPDHIAKEVKNWTDTLMSFDKKGKRKGRDDGGGSRFQVDTPKIDAINGGSPSTVLIDEIGLMEMFGGIMREGRPTMFKFDPETGGMKLQQQFIAWGTGGEMDKGGSVFEAEFKNTLKQWREKNYSYGIIPIFMNCYARPGVTKKHIENEKKAYLTLQGTKKGDEAKVQFHQHYPVTIDDMFIRKSRTMVPIAYCNNRLDSIYGGDKELEYGYFEPILNPNDPTPDLFYKFRLLGAKWVPTSGRDAVSTTAVIVRHPPQGDVWVDRWYQGTDPINSETGHSKMSSSIWDDLEHDIASMVFSREKKFKETYAQVLLQKLYYDQEGVKGVLELLENNIGDMHLDFQENLGFKNRFVANKTLPLTLQNNTKWFGISNKTDTAPRIIAKIEEMLDVYGDNLDIPWIWEQLKTFVEKDLKSSNSHRQTRYQAADLRYDYDDAIFSAVLSYINAMTHAKYEPRNIKEGFAEKKTFKRYVQNKDTNFRQKLALVDTEGKVLKILS